MKPHILNCCHTWQRLAISGRKMEPRVILNQETIAELLNVPKVQGNIEDSSPWFSSIRKESWGRESWGRESHHKHQLTKKAN